MKDQKFIYSKDTKPVKMDAGDSRVMLCGRPISVDFRILAEDYYLELVHKSEVQPDPMQEIIDKIKEYGQLIGERYLNFKIYDDFDCGLNNRHNESVAYFGRYNPTDTLSKLNNLIKETRGGE